MQKTDSSAPESLDEAAGRCAAKLASQFVERQRLIPLPAGGVDVYDLQERFITAFRQGADWMHGRVLQTISAPIPPANRRPI